MRAECGGVEEWRTRKRNGRQKGAKETKTERKTEVEEPLMSFAKGRNFGGVRWLIASGVVVGAR